MQHRPRQVRAAFVLHTFLYVSGHFVCSPLCSGRFTVFSWLLGFANFAVLSFLLYQVLKNISCILVA